MPRKIEIREGLFQCWEGVTNEVVSGKRQVCSFTVEPQSSQKEMISLIVSKKCDIQNTLNHSLFQLRLFLKLCVPYCVKCPEITDIVCGYNVYMHFIQLPKSWQTLKEICLFFFQIVAFAGPDLSFDSWSFIVAINSLRNVFTTYHIQTAVWSFIEAFWLMVSE